MVNTKQNSRKMKMGTRRVKKSKRSRKQRGGQAVPMLESTTSSSSTSTISPSSSTSTMSKMPASKLPMPTSTRSMSTTSTSTVPLKSVDLYFKLESAQNIPKFISSSDPGITVDDTKSSSGKATITIKPSLGNLHDYSGSGWSQASKWISLPPSRMDKPANALRLTQGNKLIRKRNGLSIQNNQIKLPSLLSNVEANGLDKATFGIGINPGDPNNGNAVIKITFMFAVV